jgi:hypothetical protein
MSLSDQLLQVLHGNEDGVSDNELKRYFGDRYGELVPIINELLGANRIQLFLQGEALFYRLNCLDDLLFRSAQQRLL